MEMRSLESIQGPGIDLTTHLPPLASSLSDPFLHSHCSSCFRPLPLPTTNPTPTHYCSQRCSHLDLPLHFSSAEHHLFLLNSHPTITTTTDLRLALRLLHRFRQLSLLPSHPTDRISGLLTNHNNLKHQDHEISERITQGGKLMARARRLRDGVGEVEEEEEEESNWVEEMVLGVVLTNAVEVQVDDKHGVGIAVYGKTFSWVNHSCAPNACYRFSMCGSNEEVESSSMMRIGAFGDESLNKVDEGNELCGYGPRIVVRSIKPTDKGEEVCVAYTDLLQPKATRQLELWSRYMFICCCWRCQASTPTYVDRVLLGYLTISSWDHNHCSDDAYEELSCYMDEIIDEYLSTGNPVSCCDKLESLLIQYPRKELIKPDEQSRPTFKLHPLHHLSLTAYITLSSAYKIRARELLSSPTVTEKHRLEAFKLSRTSAAYSLLLAGAAHHLFYCERSLVVPAVHFWINAGESLITLARSLIRDSTISLSCTHGKCSVVDRLKALADCHQSQRSSTETEFQDICNGFTNCASRLALKVWPFVIQGMHYFYDIMDPIDFRLPNENTCSLRTMSRREDGGGCGLVCETKNDSNEEIIFELGTHCLLYGAYLGSICYGTGSYLTNFITNFLDIPSHGCGLN